MQTYSDNSFPIYQTSRFLSSEINLKYRKLAVHKRDLVDSRNRNPIRAVKHIFISYLGDETHRKAHASCFRVSKENRNPCA